MSKPIPNLPKPFLTFTHPLDTHYSLPKVRPPRGFAPPFMWKTLEIEIL
jgi:hypothetical protein